MKTSLILISKILWVIGLTCSSTFSYAHSESNAAPKEIYRLYPWADGGVLAVTALGNIVPLVFADEIINKRCPCDPNEVNPFDRSTIGSSSPLANTVSDYTVAVAFVAPAILDWMDVGTSKAFAEDMLIFTETLAVNGALVSLVKYTVQRPLPRVYSGQDPVLATRPGGYRAFYSGHTSTAFSALAAASMTQNLRHGFNVWPWIITAVTGTSVAAERVADGRHFYTDVIVGALAGTAVGILVPYLHTIDPGLAIVPLADGVQVSVMRKF